MTLVSSGRASRTRLARLLAISATLLTLLSSAFPAHGQGGGATWELRVCADPDNLPYSNRERQGFENRIIAILADELQADLSYAWLPLPRREGQEALMLRLGECDLLAAVPDGTDPYLTTLAYYRSTAVFVTRKDAPFKITSLDDPLLHELQIGVQRGSPEDYALVGRGMIDNVHHFFVSDPGESILRQVADGALDVGIVWGPIAGYYAARLDLPLVLTPVSPEIDVPFLPMVQAISLAVRRGDEAFRDLLDRALAVRWREIQAVLETYHVPQLSLPTPELGQADREASGGGVQAHLGLGVILPSLSGTDPLFPLGDELVGEPAQQGAVLADEVLDDVAETRLEVLLASAPSSAAARRAAERLVVAQHVSGLIGGLGEGQAEAIAALAREREVPFLNVGDADERLRSAACYPTTFHVEASEGMYLGALVRAIREAGLERWFIVQNDTPAAARQYRILHRLLSGGGTQGREVGRQVVPVDQALFLPTFAEIEESGADAVVLLLDAGGQLVFLGQYEDATSPVEVFGFPAPLTQTRQYYAALKQDAPQSGAGWRIALWDAALDQQAAELNERFSARWGRPMDPSAWAAYAAVEILVAAAARAETTEPRSLLTALAAPDSDFDVHKGVAAAFGADDHQLRQLLYLVALDPVAGTLLELAAPEMALMVDADTGADAGECQGGPF